jgi:hypothetical protein
LARSASSFCEVDVRLVNVLVVDVVVLEEEEEELVGGGLVFSDAMMLL